VTDEFLWGNKKNIFSVGNGLNVETHAFSSTAAPSRAIAVFFGNGTVNVKPFAPSGERGASPKISLEDMFGESRTEIPQELGFSQSAISPFFLNHR